AAAPAFCVETVGDRQRVRVGLDDAVDLGAVSIDGVDPGEVLLDQRSRCVLATRQALLQIGNGQLFEIEWRRHGPRRLSGSADDNEAGEEAGENERQRNQSGTSHRSSSLLKIRGRASCRTIGVWRWYQRWVAAAACSTNRSMS